MLLDITGAPMPLVKELIEKYPNMTPVLYDSQGIWGELPLTENNLDAQVDEWGFKGNFLMMGVS